MSRIAEAGMSDLIGFTPAPSIAPDAPRYPGGPGFKGARGGPSEQAAKTIARSVTGRRADVLGFLRIKAAQPMTADAIAVQLNRSVLSIRPRVSELHAMGLIEPSEDRGRNESGMSASKWRAVPADRLPTNQDQTP